MNDIIEFVWKWFWFLFRCVVVSFSARSILLRCYIPSLLLLFYSPECGDDRFHANRAVHTRHGNVMPELFVQKSNAILYEELVRITLPFVHITIWLQLRIHQPNHMRTNTANTHTLFRADNSSIEIAKVRLCRAHNRSNNSRVVFGCAGRTEINFKCTHTPPPLMDPAEARDRRIQIKIIVIPLSESVGPHRASNQMPRETKTNVSWQWHALALWIASLAYRIHQLRFYSVLLRRRRFDATMWVCCVPRAPRARERM